MKTLLQLLAEIREDDKMEYNPDLHRLSQSYHKRAKDREERGTSHRAKLVKTGPEKGKRELAPTQIEISFPDPAVLQNPENVKMAQEILNNSIDEFVAKVQNPIHTWYQTYRTITPEEIQAIKDSFKLDPNSLRFTGAIPYDMQKTIQDALREEFPRRGNNQVNVLKASYGGIDARKERNTKTWASNKGKSGDYALNRKKQGGSISTGRFSRGGASGTADS